MASSRATNNAFPQPSFERIGGGRPDSDQGDPGHMTSHGHDRAIIIGFAMAYAGVMGLLLMMSSPNLSAETERAIRLALAAIAMLGSVILLAAKLIPIRGD